MLLFCSFGKYVGFFVLDKGTGLGNGVSFVVLRRGTGLKILGFGKGLGSLVLFGLVNSLLNLSWTYFGSQFPFYFSSRLTSSFCNGSQFNDC